MMRSTLRTTNYLELLRPSCNCFYACVSVKHVCNTLMLNVVGDIQLVKHICTWQGIGRVDPPSQVSEIQDKLQIEICCL
jgi:hypothetical protein